MISLPGYRQQLWAAHVRFGLFESIDLCLFYNRFRPVAIFRGASGVRFAVRLVSGG
jgi:hypothetical protein